jgi:predicted RNase H-like HicB family nuclease
MSGGVPGLPGAHSQGATLGELRANLQEVVEMLLEEGDPRLESEFIGTQTVEVAEPRGERAVSCVAKAARGRPNAGGIGSAAARSSCGK